MTKGLKETLNFATSSLTEWLTAPGCKGCKNFIVCQYERKNRRNIWHLHKEQMVGEVLICADWYQMIISSLCDQHRIYPW
jgi:hypothetical protein